MYWIGNEHWWTIVRWLQVCVGAFGIFSIVRYSMQLPVNASICGALTYALTGYFPFFYLYPSFFVSSISLPYIVYFGHRLYAGGPTPVSYIGLTLSLALQFLGGQPQIVLCVMLSLVVMLALYGIRSIVIGDTHYWSRLLHILFAAALAVLIAAPQIIPFAVDQLRGDTVSGHELQLVGQPARTTGFLNIFNIVSAAPLSQFRPWFQNRQLAYTPFEDFAFTLGFIGSWLLLLGLIDTFSRHSGSSRRWLVRCSGIIFMALYGIVILQAARIINLWPFSFANYSRYIVPVLTLFASILVAQGYQHLTILLRNRLRRSLLLLYGLASIVLSIPLLEFLIITTHPATHFGELDANWHSALYYALIPALIFVTALGLLTYFMCKDSSASNRKRAAVIVLAGLAVELCFSVQYGLPIGLDDWRFAILTTAAASAALSLASTRRFRLYGAGLVVATAAIWTVFWLAFVPSPPIIANWKQQSDRVFAFFDKGNDDGGRKRYLAMRYEPLKPDWNAAAGVDSIAANMAIAPVYYTGLIWTFVRPEALTSNAWLGHNCFFWLDQDIGDRWNDPFPGGCAIHLREYLKSRVLFNVLSVTDLVSIGDRIGQFVTQKAVKGITREADLGCDAKVDNNCPQVYADTQALPRSYITSNFRAAPFTRDAWGARESMKENWQSLRERPVVEFKDADLSRNRFFMTESPTAQASALSGVSEVIPAKIIRYQPNLVEIDYKADSPSLLVLNDLFHPFWRASINGKPASILRVNSAVRGVLVPVGTGRVIFSFTWLWIWCAGLSAIGALGLAIACFWARQMKGQPRRRGGSAPG